MMCKELHQVITRWWRIYFGTCVFQ